MPVSRCRPSGSCSYGLYSYSPCSCGPCLCRDVDRADPVVRRVGDVHNVAQRRDGDAKRLVEPIQKCSYGLCSYGLYSYGLYSYGLYSYGLYSYGREGDAERLVESI